MANCSSTNGTFTFDKDFYNQNKQLINDYFDKAKLDGCYGIEILGANDEGSFDFDGTGRWSMEYSLPWVLSPACIEKKNPTPAEQEQIKLFWELLDKMIKADTKVEFEYDDEESGAAFYVHQNAVVVANKDRKEDDVSNFFKIKSCKTENLGYNEYNLINNDYEEGYFMDSDDNIEALKNDFLNDWYADQPEEYRQEHSLDSIVEALKKLAKDDSDYNGAIEAWHFDCECDDIVREALEHTAKQQA